MTSTKNLTYQEFTELSLYEKKIYISELVHLLETSKMCFNLINEVIDMARGTSLLNNVKFGNEKEAKA